MAGRKQHYIQKLLLKQFSDTPDADNPALWVYRYSGKCYSAKVNDIGAQRDYYSKPGVPSEETFDDKLTDYEDDITNPALIAILNKEINATLDVLEIAPLITSYSIRNDHFRKSSHSIMERSIEWFAERLTDEPKLNGNPPIFRGVFQ